MEHVCHTFNTSHVCYICDVTCVEYIPNDFDVILHMCHTCRYKRITLKKSTHMWDLSCNLSSAV